MRSRMTTLGTLLLTVIAIMSGAVSDRNPTLAADYSCHKATCPGIAQCSGDHWAQSGSCGVTCYKESGAPGQIVFNGSADCSSPQSGGGGGGTIGFFLGDGGYCYDNWWWDSACSGPDDPYTPTYITE